MSGLRGPRRLLALALRASVALAAARPAGAEPLPPPAPRGAARVQVVLTGSFGDDRALAALVHEWLASSGLDPVVTRAERLELAALQAPNDDGAPVRLWLVPVSTARARLYLADPEARRYYVRDVPIATRLDELERERVAQVLLSSTLAFLAGAASVPLDRVERALLEGAATPTEPGAASAARSSDAVPAPPRAAPDHAALPVTIGAGALFGAADEGAAGLAAGPGLLLELGTALERVRVGGQLEGVVRLPREVPTEHLVLVLRAATASAAAEACAALHPRLCWRLAAGAGVAVITVAPTPRRDAAVTALASDRASAAFLRFAVGPEWHRRGARATLGAYLDVAPVGLRYELAEGAARTAELVLPRVAAGASLAIGFERPLAARHAAAPRRSARAAVAAAPPAPGGGARSR